MFQWTPASVQRSAQRMGELPALLLKVKTTTTGSLQQYFGEFGIDIFENELNDHGFITCCGEMSSALRLKRSTQPEWGSALARLPDPDNKVP